MMLLCGLRGATVGADTHNYIDFAKGYIDKSNYNPVYIAFRQIGMYFGGHENIFLMLMAMVTYIPLYYTIKKESPLPACSVLIYMIASSRFYLETFNISRQSIAIVFLLISFCLFARMRIKSSIAALIGATCFHPSSIIVLPFYLLYYSKPLKEKYVYLLLGISVVIGLSDTTAFVSDILTQLYAFSDNGSELSYLGKYAGRELNLEWNMVGKLSHCIPISLLTAFTFSKSNSDSFLYKLMFAGTIVLNILLTNRYCERFASMLLVVQILTVPVALCELEGKRKTLLLWIIGGLALYYIFVLYQQNITIGSDYNPVMPYKFFFER